MRYAIGLVLSVIAAPVLAAGFTSADLDKAAHKADAAQGQLTHETEKLRLAIAYDAAAGVGARSDSERRALGPALATGPGRGDVRARWFMAGAIPQPASGSSTRLYNPLAHAWLTLDWQRGDDGTWLVAAARLTTGAPAQWTEASGSYLKALAEDYRRARLSPGEQPAGIAQPETDRWLTDLAMWNSPSRLAAIAAVRRTISSGRTGAPIDLAPANIRASFVPIAAFDRDGGAPSLLFGTPLMPGMIVAADFAAAGELAAPHLSFVNLSAVGGRP